MGIAAGPDGNLWFTEEEGNKIGRSTIVGSMTEFLIPTAFSVPGGITAGPDGNLWFTETLGNKIGRITTAGSICEFAIPTAGSGPARIAAGPDGNLWFTEENSNKIGRIKTTGSITEFAIPTADRALIKLFTFGLLSRPAGGHRCGARRQSPGCGINGEPPPPEHATSAPMISAAAQVILANMLPPELSPYHPLSGSGKPTPYRNRPPGFAER